MDSFSPYFQTAKACISLMNERVELQALVDQASIRLDMINRFHESPQFTENQTRAASGGMVNFTLYELAILASLEYVEETHMEKFGATVIRKRIEAMGREVVNITSAMEPLEDNGWLEVVSGKEANKHKLYILTETGKEEARRLQTIAARPVGAKAQLKV